MVQNISQKPATSAHDFCERYPIEKTRSTFTRFWRANVSSSAQPLMTSVDAPMDAREIFRTAWLRRSGADICPASDAAEQPRARMGVRRPGPNQYSALEALCHKLVFPTSSHDRCAILSFRPPLRPRRPRDRGWLMPPRPELGRPRLWPTRPRRSGPSCWPMPPSPACGACGPACARATTHPARRVGKRG